MDFADVRKTQSLCFRFLQCLPSGTRNPELLNLVVLLHGIGRQIFSIFLAEIPQRSLKDLNKIVSAPSKLGYVQKLCQNLEYLPVFMTTEQSFAFSSAFCCATVGRLFSSGSSRKYKTVDHGVGRIGAVY